VTATATPPALLRALRQQVASTIADEKSYDVPGLCSRLGLADGSGEEAHRGKFRYAQQRLAGVTADRLHSIARELLTQSDSYQLSELVAKIDEVAGSPVTSLTRRRLMSLFDGNPISTELDHLELIDRVWPISKMLSGYDRPDWSMADRLFQHTVRNDDMTNREILEALGFLDCSRAKLFRFLEEVTGPEAQTPERQAELAAAIDGHLIHDGYRLVVAGKMSGAPIYAVRAAPKGSPADTLISAALARFDPHDVGPRWAEAMESRDASPGRAITLARTLLEDVCKWIIVEAGETYREADDLPALYKHLAKLLRLAPDDHTEQVFKQILGACQSVVESLGALRNKLGDAHSIGPKRARPVARHAALAVNLSGAMATFLVETWEARKLEADS
jgi:AbiJ N-terminal domain 3/Abortive infection C-terminus